MATSDDPDIRRAEEEVERSKQELSDALRQKADEVENSDEDGGSGTTSGIPGL